MTKSDTLHIRLIPKEREAIQKAVDAGIYRNMSDAARMAIREKFFREEAAL